MLVEPEEGSSELSSADRIMVSVSEATLLDSQDKEITIDDIKSGDLVQIDYDGQIAESYPAQIRGCSESKCYNPPMSRRGMTAMVCPRNTRNSILERFLQAGF